MPTILPPVSYTHLDVYKRQAEAMAAAAGKAGQPVAVLKEGLAAIGIS